MGLLTTTIGAYPKPDYVKLPDWFDDLDKSKPTQGWAEAMEAMGKDAERIIEKGTNEAVKDQVYAGIDIPTDGEIARENYIHYHCRYLKGVDFVNLTEKMLRTGNYSSFLPTVRGPVKPRKSRSTDFSGSSHFSNFLKYGNTSSHDHPILPNLRQ